MYPNSNHAQQSINQPVAQQNSQPPLPAQHQQPNGHHHHQPHNGPSHRQPPPPMSKEPVRVQAVPSISISEGQLVYGDAQSISERSYTPIKVVGDGSFGTVWLVDWHSVLPPNTKLSPMQCGAGARPEWAGKTLVALKRMKKRWEGGWDECKKLKELESLRKIPFHPNIIPLYDFFLLPTTKELYFVFESMEGNLYQLIKSRKGRPLAGGLVSSIFRQVVAGLHHIHANGYFHRDMKPENLLVTTTGLFDYRNVSPIAPPNAPPEKDVVVIVKLADFGLARETKSKPPYTEYVSTRWYRAPEVLLRSREYSNPVDTWALGTIMAELINLKPLFPGHTEVDQVARICEILGDPSDEYGVDSRNVAIGGGKWVKGIKMARTVGYTFPKLRPVHIYSLFDKSVPVSIIECISDLLKYDPSARLTCQECLDHRYITETTPGNCPPGPSAPAPLHINTAVNVASVRSPNRAQVISAQSSMNSISPRTVPPSHSNSPAHAKPSFNGVSPPLQHPRPMVPPHRTPFYPQPEMSSPLQVAALPMRVISATPEGGDAMQIQDETSHVVQAQAQDQHQEYWTSGAHPVQRVVDGDVMDVSSPAPPADLPPLSLSPQPMDVTVTSIQVLDDIHKTIPAQDPSPNPGQPIAPASHGGSTFKLFKKRTKLLGGMFGHGEKVQQNSLPPVDELSAVPSKRSQSSSTDSRSLSELSPIMNGASDGLVLSGTMDPKMRKKEADRVALEAEKAKHELARKRMKEQARGVMQNRHRLIEQNNSNKQATDFDWESATPGTFVRMTKPKPKPRAGSSQAAGSSSATINAAGGRFRGATETPAAELDFDSWREADHRTKARRRDFDDDHSMSSSDLPSVGRLSVMSFATVESDPSSNHLRARPSMWGLSRMQSTSSLRTSFASGDDFSRSSHSPSFDNRYSTDYDSRASCSSYDATRSSFSGTSSPPPMQSLSLSSPQQSSPVVNLPHFINLPPPHPSMHPLSLRVPTPSSPYEYGQYGQIQNQPPSPAIAPHPIMNPIFKVPPMPSEGDEDQEMSDRLPPFSQLASVASS
ncbi:kinase-like protein [Schizopora paradoxa]|uniref:Kinase-like protein n=1 Tax=Schizopora paradoxa TaxID=27342 RepID=A0A0H2RSB4_9AGAM|nr:kinase-like protein [Schizopora paradoxa]